MYVVEGGAEVGRGTLRVEAGGVDTEVDATYLENNDVSIKTGDAQKKETKIKYQSNDQRNPQHPIPALDPLFIRPITPLLYFVPQLFAVGFGGCDGGVEVG